MHGGDLHYAIFKDVHSRALQIQKDYDAVSVVLRGSCDEGPGMKDAKSSSAAGGSATNLPLSSVSLDAVSIEHGLPARVIPRQRF